MGEWKIGLKESLIDMFCETQNSLLDIERIQYFPATYIYCEKLRIQNGLIRHQRF
jgi:hypothetical protein